MRRIGVGLLAAAFLCVPVANADTGASTRARMLGEVQQGIAAASAHWAWRGWYQDVRGVPGWSSIWDTEQLFQAYIGRARAQPTLRNRNAVVWFAAKSEEGYYNPTLGDGVGGFSTGFGHHGEQGQQWFDDNGWLGLSFLDAYRETHRGRFLRDAEIAFRYLYTAGWDPIGGGIWWNTQHTVKSAESVITAALLAVELHELHAGSAYLADARRLIDWAGANLYDARSGLYVNHPHDGVAISYLESPMLDVFLRLCTGEKLYCNRVGPLTTAMLARFGGALHQQPQFDATYIRYLLDDYALTRDPRFYAVAAENAQRIERDAVDASGFYAKAWNGGTKGVEAGLISVDGAALEVLAWTAAATPA